MAAGLKVTLLLLGACSLWLVLILLLELAGVEFKDYRHERLHFHSLLLSILLLGLKQEVSPAQKLNHHPFLQCCRCLFTALQGLLETHPLALDRKLKTHILKKLVHSMFS